MRLVDIGEFGFINRIARFGGIRPQGVLKGIGDDCAVVSTEPDECLLVTTDMLVERVHFMLAWFSPQALGEKALVVNLSDIAACGGTPRDAFISLAIPGRIGVEWLELFYKGFQRIAAQYQVNILGGDTTKSLEDLVLNVALTGVVQEQEILFRHTAKAGDLVALTGSTGESAAGCHILRHCPNLSENISARLFQAHRSPRPHVEEGRMLAQSGACSAAIDVSDGLSSDLYHICAESGLGALIREDLLPVNANLVEAGRITGVDPLDWILHGGEDYVLLAAIKPDMAEWLRKKMSQKGHSIIFIGEFVSGDNIRFVRRSGQVEQLNARGWDHFR